MTGLEFKQNICIFYLVDHVREVHILDLHDVALLLQKPINKRSQITRRHISSCRNLESLTDWKSARPTWALAGVVGLVDWEVSLANSGQVAEVVGLADWEIGLAD
jgi:hypothetical protein